MKSSYFTGVWLAILAAFGFSFKAILVKLAYAQPAAVPVAVITLLLLRMVFAFPVFFFVGLRESRNAAPLSARDWAALVALGLLGYYGAVMLDFMGLRYISAGLERLIAFTHPTMTVLFGALLLGKRIERREWVALSLCYVGMAVAFVHDLGASADAAGIWIGGALVFASALCYALYLVGAGQMIQRIGPSRFSALAMLVSTAAVLAHFLATQPLSALLQPWPIYALGLSLALFSTILPVFAQSAAMRHIGAGRAALIGSIGPLLTIFFGNWLLEEVISPAQIAGALLVIAGVIVVSRR
ncbi:EamA domain-containing membrane protein RarD [Georgfuchsia toluolica]|uniref:EamA domain-containing membrane protein RarD n=1 Tax=Georgfuchsia toluolica TaxID=424218 RepID=A0A916MYR6_9PROT|nr:DMT family transporter [Georgfuchsia toluolica]CAG4882124.1 EamA domain-containing membrane protein RarD [Georgfuchsia toluolica]CAG4885458.1 EamA domain-containing membrane protein RarD [Georgfuchsia toluolica]